MADNYHILPLDTTNTGKKVRTNTRTVGGQTVHEPYAILMNAIAIADQTLEVKRAVINATASGDTDVVAAVVSKKIRVLAINFVCSAAVNVSWKDDTPTTLVPAQAWAANGGMSDNWAPHGFFFETAAGKKLIINLSGVANVYGSINYVEV